MYMCKNLWHNRYKVILMRIPFLDYITPRIFPKIRRDHRLKDSGTIIRDTEHYLMSEERYSVEINPQNLSTYRLGSRILTGFSAPRGGQGPHPHHCCEYYCLPDLALSSFSEKYQNFAGTKQRPFTVYTLIMKRVFQAERLVLM